MFLIFRYLILRYFIHRSLNVRSACLLWAARDISSIFIRNSPLCQHSLDTRLGTEHASSPAARPAQILVSLSSLGSCQIDNSSQWIFVQQNNKYKDRTCPQNKDDLGSEIYALVCPAHNVEEGILVTIQLKSKLITRKIQIICIKDVWFSRATLLLTFSQDFRGYAGRGTE